MNISELLKGLSSMVWGIPSMILLVGTGLFLTFRFGFVQFRGFKHALEIVSGKFDREEDPGEISHFRALCTALSGTVGTGNIIGVAAAVLMGGPGALFWMWITAIVGMATKFTSCTLAVHFRKVDEAGEVHGGPMHFIEMGMGRRFKWLAVIYATFTAIASFGIGNMFQVNSMVGAIKGLIFGSETAAASGADADLAIRLTVGICTAFVVAFVIIGGIKRIASWSGKIVPFMCFFYVAGALFILAKNASMIIPGFSMILTQAFSAPESVSGGLLGGVIRSGVSRGLFSNEAGLGSAAMAHSAAKTNEPVREGLVAMLEPFIDTLVICTITGLVIICTGAHEAVSDKALVTSYAFNTGLPGAGALVSISILFFAFSTLIAWSYYGDRAVDYLLGKEAVVAYRWIYVVFIMVGALYSLEDVINFCDTANGLMALPNLIALVVLSPVVFRLTRDYWLGLNERGADSLKS